MSIVGYILILLMGLTLGLMGAGGSILTIPILVYIFKIPISISTKYSLIIVGSTAIVGILRDRKLIFLKKSILFCIPSLLGIILTRYYLLPHLPAILWGVYVDDILTTLLILVMTGAAYFLLKKNDMVYSSNEKNKRIKNFNILLTGLIVGLMMGLLGVGGGFLIVPALISLGIPIKNAVPTSLFIIAMNATVGSLVDQRETSLNEYKILVSLILVAWIGMYFGTLINKKIPAHHLKKAFGILLLIVSATMAVFECYF